MWMKCVIKSENILSGWNCSSSGTKQNIIISWFWNGSYTFYCVSVQGLQKSQRKSFEQLATVNGLLWDRSVAYMTQKKVSRSKQF